MKIYDTVPSGYTLTRAGFEKSIEIKTNREIPLETDYEVAQCREWIRIFVKPQKSVNPKAYSYSLKHRVEDWGSSYVSNGDFIRAALLEGYKFSTSDDLNAFFNMELSDEKWRNTKPTHFTKWLFNQRDDNSLIGDLARDAYDDPMWSRTSKRFYDFWTYLKSLYVSNVVIESLLSAWREYSGQEPPYPDDDIVVKCESFYNGECDIVRYNENCSSATEGFTYIYVLFEDEPKRKVKYVGQTIQPAQRLKQHILSPGNIEKLAWIGKMVNEGKFPCMGIVDIVPLTDASRMERTYVYAFADFQQNDGKDIKDILLNKSLT